MGGTRVWGVRGYESMGGTRVQGYGGYEGTRVWGVRGYKGTSGCPEEAVERSELEFDGGEKEGKGRKK